MDTDDVAESGIEGGGRGICRRRGAVHGSYLAIGEENYGCCQNGRFYLNQGLSWTSTDGRQWQLHHVASLNGATIRGLLTDGSRLYAYGDYSSGLGVGHGGTAVAAVWVSTDGLSWTRSTPAGMSPGLLALSPRGLLGVGTQFHDVSGDHFLRSADGLHWTATSGRYSVSVAGLAVGTDGSSLAIAWPNDSAFGGGTVAFRSADGTSWSGPEPVSNAMLRNLVAVPGGFLAIEDGTAAQLDGSTVQRDRIRPIAWSPTAPAIDLGLGPFDGLTLDRMLIAGRDVVVLRGTLADAASTSVAWISTDGGVTFGRLPAQVAAANADASIAGFVETQTGLVAVGRTGNEMMDSGMPLAWLIER